MNCFDMDKTCTFWAEGEKHLPLFSYTTKHKSASFALAESLSLEPKQLSVLYDMMMMMILRMSKWMYMNAMNDVM
jgi:hypothetical protein